MNDHYQALLSKARLNDSLPAIRRFWYGKLVQCMGENGLFQSPSPSLYHQLLTEAEDEPDDDSCTCLSPHVHHLITRSIPHPLPPCDMTSIIDDTLLLQWGLIEQHVMMSPLHPLDYNDIVMQLGWLSSCLRDSISNIDKTELITKWQSFFDWTNNPLLYVDCYDLLLSGRAHLSLSILTANIERSLGDVFLTVSPPGSKCPHLMKDLISTNELTRVFGETPIMCLRGLIGSPKGLNLRNIVWHGFVHPNEIPPDYVMLLLIIVASLGKILKSQFISVSHRSNVTFPQEHLLLGTFPVCSLSDCQELTKAFTNSYLILPSMLPHWISAVNSFENQNYGHVLCQLLPALEHSCRLLYACSNDCPQRILTAESTQFYTTFDEILSPNVKAELDDGSICENNNKIIEEMGHQKMEMLHDLLVYPYGPRLRDKLSHGEVDLSSVSKLLANHVLCICVAFALSYSTQPIPSSGILNLIQNAADNYISLFHPSSLLKRQLLGVADELDKINDSMIILDGRDGELVVNTQPHSCYVSTLAQLVDAFPDTHHVKAHSQHFICSLSEYGHHGNTLSRLINDIWMVVMVPHQSVFMGRNNLEVIAILRQLAEHLHASLQQVMQQ